MNDKEQNLPAGDGLTDEGAMRIALQIMANLEDRSGLLDDVDDDTKADIADEIAVAIRTALAATRQPGEVGAGVKPYTIESLRGGLKAAANYLTASAQQDEREALKPCPWCGEIPPDDSHTLIDGGYKYGAIVCACGTPGPDVRTDFYEWPHWKQRAIAAWNQRATQQVQADARGEVVITWDEGRTRILAVTRQDDDGQILSIIAEAPAQVQADAVAVAWQVRSIGRLEFGWEACTQDFYKKTAETWRYGGYEGAQKAEARALYLRPAAESDKRDGEHADVGRLLYKAACELPDGWEIQVRVERGWGGVVVHDEAGETTDLDDGESSISEQIERAIRAAMSREQSGGDRG